ncbi:MAG: hypothetical protein FH753_00435 [Firmicutes bacterium]|nr:hypothetical protein [Bacillota bacterium]
MEKRFFQILIEKIFPSLAWLFFTFVLTLEYLANKSMGFYRHIMVKNQTLKFMTRNLDKIRWIIIIGIIIILIKVLFNKIYKRTRKKRLKCMVITILMSILLIFVTSFNTLNIITFPWLVLSIIIIIFFQYIRLIYTK